MLKSLVFIALIGVLAVPADARQVDQQEVAEVFATDVPQEKRLYCQDTRLFTLADGTEYRACIDWRAQNRTRLLRTYAALHGPDTDVDANLDLARTCFALAVASQNDPYRKAFDQDAFLDAARKHFAACAASRNLQRTDEYSLRLYDTGVWLG